MRSICKKLLVCIEIVKIRMSENWYVVGFENKKINRTSNVPFIILLFFVEENAKTTSKSNMNYVT